MVKYIVSGSADLSVKCWRVSDGLLMWSSSSSPDLILQEADFRKAKGMDKGYLKELALMGAIME